jgi:hypothetical protein
VSCAETSTNTAFATNTAVATTTASATTASGTEAVAAVY